MPLPDLIRTFARPHRPVVKSAAGVAGQFVPVWGYGGQTPIRKDWDAERAILEGFEVCPWVFACIAHQVRVVASLPWVVEERQGRRDPKWVRVDDPLEEKLEYPNKFMSRQFFFSMLVQHLGLSGNGLAKINLVNGKPDEFWPLNPAVTHPVPHDKKWLSHYEVFKIARGTGKPEELPPERVLHAQHPNPRNPFWGFSPLQACGAAVDAEVQRDQWDVQTARNRGIAFGAFQDPNLVSDAQIKEAAGKLEEFFSRPIGDGSARRPLVYGGEASWLRMSLTPQELERMATRHFSVAQVAAAYGQLVALLLPDGQTYNNLSTAVAHMVEHSALPVADLIRDALNTQLIPREDRARRWITYDTSGVKALKRKLTEQLADVKTGTEAGVQLNDMLQVADLAIQPQPGGDRSRYPTNLVEFDEGGEGDDAETEEP